MWGYDYMSKKYINLETGETISAGDKIKKTITTQIVVKVTENGDFEEVVNHVINSKSEIIRKGA